MATLNVDFVTETCCYEGCNLTFAFTEEFYRQVKDSHEWWYCPAGHRQHYTGKSDAQRLRDAAARETALKDQLRAAVRDAEAARVRLLRDRQRFANGVCLCCNRTFPNVAAHMRSVHPEYVRENPVAKPPRYECSCGQRFDSFRGLRTHQGHLRDPDTWDKPDTPAGWRWGGSHLTVAT